MKNRFKFRAWVKSENTMIAHREVIERAHFQFEDRIGEDNDIVMQCTGLEDRSGKLVYEGDIVEYYVYHEYDEVDCSIGVVEFDEFGYRYCLNLSSCKQRKGRKKLNSKVLDKDIIPKELTGKLDGFNKYFGDFISCKIRGNIYENKELLND